MYFVQKAFQCFRKDTSKMSKTSQESPRIYYAGEKSLLTPVVFSSARLRTSTVRVRVWNDSKNSSIIFASRKKPRVVARAMMYITAQHTLDDNQYHNPVLDLKRPLEIDHGLRSTMAPSSIQEEPRSAYMVRTLYKIAVAIKYIATHQVTYSVVEQHSIRREISYNVQLKNRLDQVKRNVLEKGTTMRQWSILGTKDVLSWEPVVELVGYYLHPDDPKRCVILTSLVWGVDLSEWMKNEEQLIKSLNSAIGVRKYYPDRLTLMRLWISLVLLRRVFQLHEAGFRHNDLKPSNIMIDMVQCTVEKSSACNSKTKPIALLKQLITDTHPVNVNSIDVKLIDLGNATTCFSNHQCGGTPAYTSPEQVLFAYHKVNYKKVPTYAPEEKLPLDNRTDLWSLGLILVELLTGVELSDALCGKRPLEYLHRGYNRSGWSMHPEKYIQHLYVGFFESPRAQQQSDTYTGSCLYIAAKKIFQCFLQMHPDSRKGIEDVMLVLLECALALRGICWEKILGYLPNMSPALIPMWIDWFFME